MRFSRSPKHKLLSELQLFVCLSLLIGHLDSSHSHQLSAILDELNSRLGATTNIVYCEQTQQLRRYFSPSQPQLINQLIFTSTQINASELSQQLSKNLLIVLLVETPPFELLQQLRLEFQSTDFLLVIEGDQNNDELGASWLLFVTHAWQQGYVKLLYHTPHNGRLYAAQLFPHVQLVTSSVSHYVETRSRFDNMHGFEIRVATYNNPPRSLIYKDHEGRTVYGGFKMRLLRHFLELHNASIVLDFASHTNMDCSAALAVEQVDICADAMAADSDAIAVTSAVRMSYGNIIVANSVPLSTYRYLVAPFHTHVWLCLLVYIVLIVCFMSFIYWRQQRRWIFSKFLLEAVRSLLVTGFSLKELRGRERYLLFVILFVAGFVFSTYYLCFLKSMLATEVYGPQINTFEQLVAANITIIVDDYNKFLCERHALPDMLWQLIQIVPVEMVNQHRSHFNQTYAYILFSDRWDLFSYAQKYVRHQPIRHIPFNILFLYAGYPMRKTWFLKDHLSTAWANTFDSGLYLKILTDANYETVRAGLMHFLITEYYEAKPLGLDYFVMPAIALGLGYGMAFLSFVIELTARRMRRAGVV